MNVNSLIYLAILVLDIIAIVDIVRGGMTTGKKVLWILGVLIFPLLGMVLYYVLKKRNPVKIVEGTQPPMPPQAPQQ